MNPREQLLQAALRVYAEAGFRGTTTRRVAEEAGVNEVTLFRQFGSKDVLIKAALEAFDRAGQPAPLPAPINPRAELYTYVLRIFQHFYDNRHLIRRVMGDLVEHPEIAPVICEDPGDEYLELTRYFSQLRDTGRSRPDAQPERAAGLLLGGILTHALWSDFFPDVDAAELVLRDYADLTLDALGVERPVEADR